MKLALALAVAGLLASAAPASADTTSLACGEETSLTVTAKPRTCFLGWPDLPLAEAVGLRQIRWRSWGGREATARAVFRVKTYDPFTAVTVRAYRRQTCASGLRIYTRVRVRFARVSHTWRTPDCIDL